MGHVDPVQLRRLEPYLRAGEVITETGMAKSVNVAQLVIRRER